MSDTDIQPTRHVVPIQRGKNSAAITPPWFVNGSEYEPKLGTFQTLVNGEEAFKNIYNAIANAKSSVCYICWAFQPSMYFIRDGNPHSLMIGQLLEQKAREGIMVRVLCWALGSNFSVNLTGFNESNTPGRSIESLKSRAPNTSSDQQYGYDAHFYRVYDRKQSILGELRREYIISDDYPKDTLIFASRTFSYADQAQIALDTYADEGMSDATRTMLALTPTHHQKMVLVDYETPKGAIGFVMGHNTLDAYWDTSRHSQYRCLPNLGRNGVLPRHDYSSRVTGPVVGDLFRNFASAWQLETEEELSSPDFRYYPLNDGDGNAAMCQVLRTQIQFGHRQDIMKCYLQAVANATQYIHIENQYFRWQPLADKIKACVAKQMQDGRSIEKQGPLYLFVISNTSDEAIGYGIFNTYRMLDSLGRADTLPGVARDQRLKDIDAQLDQNETAMKPLLSKRAALDSEAQMLSGAGGGQDLNDRYEPINARLGPLETKQQELLDAKARLSPLTWRERTFGSKRTVEAIKASDVPGLKVHVATLVAPDTVAGEPWQEVYIHAKLMLIDDTFMTLGSANINTRSMQSDSELNIAHHRPEISGPLRTRQWAQYTGGRVIGNKLSAAYMAWGDVMAENANARKTLGGQPVAQLAEFMRTSDKISNKD